MLVLKIYERFELHFSFHVGKYTGEIVNETLMSTGRKGREIDAGLE
jgi:hypothetical protein